MDAENPEEELIKLVLEVDRHMLDESGFEVREPDSGTFQPQLGTTVSTSAWRHAKTQVGRLQKGMGREERALKRQDFLDRVKGPSGQRRPPGTSLSLNLTLDLHLTLTLNLNLIELAPITRHLSPMASGEGSHLC